ncbi:unnamed protein product [Lactuca virosa]|uniref:Uncharacterized protein n=1 Tax=Lactuca virosa TaxID=75947 RepID=A0AAU9MHE1_9ASTR|nr:unnamed protein product [Lactuca virosa]
MVEQQIRAIEDAELGEKGVSKDEKNPNGSLISSWKAWIGFETQSHLLDIIRRHASGLLQETRKDDYVVKEKPLLMEDIQGGLDYIAKYAQIYEYLCEEYEVTQRFGNLDYKLKFVEFWNGASLCC